MSVVGFPFKQSGRKSCASQTVGGEGGGGCRLQALSRQPGLFLNCRLPGLIGKSEV